MEISQFILLIFSFFLIAFFSGVELAFLTANKLRIELSKTKGNASGRILAEFSENKSRFISAMIVGLNIGLILFSSVMSDVLRFDHFGFLPKGSILLLIVQTLITTSIVLFLGEFIPKTLFRINPDKTLAFLAIPVKYLAYYPLLPLTLILEGIAKFVMRILLRKEIREEKEEFGSVDLEYLIKEVYSGDKQDEVENQELDADIFEKALYLKDVKVRECMVHRMKIEALKDTATLQEITEKFIDTKHSRLIVFQENIDNILGYIHHQELFSKKQELTQMLRPILRVTETMSARDLLHTFIKESKNIAWVIDEHGGTAGIITLEDLMEEIFGEIKDEHDEEENIERVLDNDTYILSGALEIDYLNEKYNFNIPEGEYETLAGYIIAHTEDIPDMNEEIEIDSYLIKILAAENRRIITVQFKVLEISVR